MAYCRYKVVDLARSWIGLKESDGSYKKIIDLYNSFTGPLPRGLKMQYGWSWCACTVSALAIKLGYTKIMPIEISCGEMVEQARKMGIWVENDSYAAEPGDYILYDWEDSGFENCTGWPDHIGIIESVDKKSGYFTVIEGNYQDAVKRRTISINGRFIRGFVTPKYDNDTQSASISSVSTEKKSKEAIAVEVIAGKWGTGDDRKKKLEAAGYNYKEIQNLVNKKLNGSAVTSNKSTDLNQPLKGVVTSTCYAKGYDPDSFRHSYKTMADLYCRNDAGTNKKALCLIPKGTIVKCYGYYTKVNNVNWLFITVRLDGIEYAGFSSRDYLERA